jgi:hypothetical protein
MRMRAQLDPQIFVGSTALPSELRRATRADGVEAPESTTLRRWHVSCLITRRLVHRSLAMMTSKRGWWVFGVLALAACTRNPTLENGATDFVTEEPYYGGGQRGGETNGATPSAAPGGASDKNSAPSGRTGTVEEADIYRVDQNRLFYFNTYRGFIIYDLNDPKHPQMISRLPVYGYPVEMYVDGSTVYALIRDALYLTQDGNGQKFERHDTSQLVTIDVSDLAHPVVLKTIDIIGQLREGVSRKIDNTIYVVSYIPQGYYGWWYWDWGWYGPIDTQQEQAWVYSFNIADAKNPALVDKLQIFQGGSTSSSGNTGGVSKYFTGIALSATANTLHVVENWQTYGYVSGSPYSCGASFSQQQAVVSIIDISDPAGSIRLHTKFDTYGNLNDQFKQTYVYDAASQHGYYYGIFERQEWASSNCSGSQFTQNQFEAWDITNGDAPVRVGALKFGEANEPVRGSTFDPDRKVAFAITARQIDPFYAIDFTNPAAPKIASEVDGLAGDISVFRFIGDQNKFVMGIGRDATDTCTGFAMGTNTWHSGIAVSIFDVQDITKTRLVQRACVDIPDAQWVSSDINWDLDQAHKMIGMGSVNGQNVVTVPVSYYKRTDESYWWWYRYSSAVGMMTWDLTKYDPTKDELHQSVLSNHGSVEHGHGNVRRTIVFNHSGDNQGMLLNLSDTYLSLYNIQNVDAPVAQAEVEIAPDVEELYRFGNFVVEHVREEGYTYGLDTASIFRVKPTGGDINATTPVAAFTVGQVERVMKWKDALVIFRRKIDPSASAINPYNGNVTSQAIVYDLSNPSAPTLRSVTDLGQSIYPYYNYWCGDFFWGYWGGWWWGGYGSNNWVAFDGGLAFSVTQYNYDSATNTQSTTNKLLYLNLADLSAPQLKEHVIDGGNRDVVALTADATDAGGFFLAYRDRIGVTSTPQPYLELAQYKYYAQRWSPSGDDIHADAATNTPGLLVRTWKSGDKTLLLSQDNVYTWAQDPNNAGNGYFNADPRLHLLERRNDSTALWRAAHVFDDRYLGSLVGDGDRVYLTTSKAYRYTFATPGTGGSSGSSSNTSTEDNADHLTVIDTSALTLDPSFDANVGLQSISAMAAGGSKLYLSVPSAGVLVVDTTDAANPTGKSFLRTLGWGTHLEMSGDTIFVAAGNFGVFQRSLGSATLSP